MLIGSAAYRFISNKSQIEKAMACFEKGKIPTERSADSDNILYVEV